MSSQLQYYTLASAGVGDLSKLQVKLHPPQDFFPPFSRAEKVDFIKMT